MKYDKDKAALEVFFDALFSGDTGNAIERQEARGQLQLVNSAVLPRDLNGDKREWYEQVGIVFHDDDDDVDNLFVKVTLPDGWKKERTDHSMWSMLVDEKGRERAGIFYKAAFYDRSAHINLKRRFSIGTNWPEDASASDASISQYILDNMTGKQLFLTESVGNRDYDARDSIRTECHDWLNERYPDYKNPAAYWDEE